jgi:rhamnogalacturonan endolyase
MFTLARAGDYDGDMLRFITVRSILWMTCALALAAADAPRDFVRIRGGLLRPNTPALRVDDFEMADHPVTNAEYQLFVQAAGYPPPLHWERGRIPAGMENRPVIFVNRYDVAAYLAWRTGKEGRIYRLPTQSEFEYAARGGESGGLYPWGQDKPAGKANYDAAGDRTFAQWRQFLKPVKSYPPNAYGLYDMAGNAWQMVDSYPDAAIAQFKYRVENPVSEEQGLAGGSWARSEYYLRCGVRGGASSGIRHPDISFRVVREPAGAMHFHRTPRRLVAAPAGNGAVFLGWQWLAGDAAQTAFHVYRTTRRDTAGERITSDPVRTSTNFIDRQAPRAGRVYYRVRPVDMKGAEGAPSEWAGYEPTDKRTGLIAVFEPTVKQGGIVPVFGDLDGDGLLDAVLRLDNGIKEMSRDPGVPVELEAFNHDGRSLWRRPLMRHDHCFGNANNVPVALYDLDGDGKAEVICRLQEGDDVYLAILDGMTGRVRRKTPWTGMVSDFAKSSTRIHLSIAYLDGKTPAIVTQTGLYENEVFDAYDMELKKLWQYKSIAETNGSGSHHIDIADVDGDGRDEVFDGTTLLNPDGSLRWSIYREHPDIVSIKHILPGSKDRQVFYAVESNVHAGAYLVDAKTGKIIWKHNREDDPRWVHAHTGWVSDIFEGSPGMEMLTNRDGHTANDLVLFGADGKILMNPFPKGWRPVNWTGGKSRDLLSSNGRQVGRFDGKGITPIAGAVPNEAGGNCNMTADLAGDFRDEVVCVGDNKVMVYSNLEPVDRRELTRTASREYRLWLARNMGAGYPSYFEWEPEK